MIVTASPKTAVKINIELTQQEASHLFSILLYASGDEFAQEFADRIELSMATSQTCPAEYAAMCGITDEMSIDFIERMAKTYKFEVQKNSRACQPCIAAVPLEMFTVQTQRLYGNTVREMVDASIVGRHTDLGFLSYYGRMRRRS